jgi:TPR repeat protein
VSREKAFFFVFFFCSLFLFHEALEVAKSGLMMFHEAVQVFWTYDPQESFARFERAAAKGHEQSIWIRRVVKDVKMEKGALIEAFAKTEEPLGWYFAGELSDGREGFEFHKKSAEGGCSWGRVKYGNYFDRGEFVEKDETVYVEWLENAMNQNNPDAMDRLGDWFRGKGNDKEKAVVYYRGAAELGWKDAMLSLVEMLRLGDGCVNDLRQAAIWSAKGDSGVFWELLRDASGALEGGVTDDLDYDFNQLCYALGWGLYWYQHGRYQHGSEDWNEQDDKDQGFGNRCLDFYCSCVELQQKSIFTFLLCWNRMTGVKGPGQMIAEMVWEAKEDNVVETLEEPQRRSNRLKRIKK